MIDLSLLQDLFGDEELVKKYLVNFKKEAPKQIENIKEHLHHNRPLEASIEAHSLKSQLAYLKENDAMQLAYSIEQLGADGEFNNCRSMHLKMQDLELRILNVLELIENDYRI